MKNVPISVAAEKLNVDRLPFSSGSWTSVLSTLTCSTTAIVTTKH